VRAVPLLEAQALAAKVAVALDAAAACRDAEAAALRQAITIGQQPFLERLNATLQQHYNGGFAAGRLPLFYFSIFCLVYLSVALCS
jgi:hypothetical protein